MDQNSLDNAVCYIVDQLVVPLSTEPIPEIVRDKNLFDRATDRARHIVHGLANLAFSDDGAIDLIIEALKPTEVTQGIADPAKRRAVALNCWYAWLSCTAAGNMAAWLRLMRIAGLSETQAVIWLRNNGYLLQVLVPRAGSRQRKETQIIDLY